MSAHLTAKSRSFLDTTLDYANLKMSKLVEHATAQADIDDAEFYANLAESRSKLYTKLESFKQDNEAPEQTLKRLVKEAKDFHKIMNPVLED